MTESMKGTREGVDRGFALNFLGAFLLARLLEERLLASAPARVINVGSAAHKLLRSVDVDPVMHPGRDASKPGSSQAKGKYQMCSYQTAKLAVTTWTYCLARRWERRGVTANVLDPGIVKGQMGAQYGGPAVMGLMMSHVISLLTCVGMVGFEPATLTPEKGVKRSRTSNRLCTVQDARQRCRRSIARRTCGPQLVPKAGLSLAQAGPLI